MTTSIEWTDKTWNPTTGCDRVSPGCDHCYALTMAKRLKAMELKRIVGLVLRLLGREPFVGDLFLAQVFAVMAHAPQHTYQILTKRPGVMRSKLTSFLTDRQVSNASWDMGLGFVDDDRWPLPNVWLGTSVEDQERADLRIPILIGTPAAVRFLSCEPLLGPVKIPFEYDCGGCTCSPHYGAHERTPKRSGDQMPSLYRTGWGSHGGDMSNDSLTGVRPQPLSDAVRYHATRHVASRAADSSDAAELLDMLGLVACEGLTRKDAA